VVASKVLSERALFFFFLNFHISGRLSTCNVLIIAPIINLEKRENETADMIFLLLLVSLATGQIFFGFDHREFGVDSRRIRDAEGSGEDPGESQVDSCCFDYSNEKPIYVFDAESTTSPSSPLIAYLSCLCEEYIFSGT
jgi:hypothetical protein